MPLMARSPVATMHGRMHACPCCSATAWSAASRARLTLLSAVIRYIRYYNCGTATEAWHHEPGMRGQELTPEQAADSTTEGGIQSDIGLRGKGGYKARRGGNEVGMLPVQPDCIVPLYRSLSTLAGIISWKRSPETEPLGE